MSFTNSLGKQWFLVCYILKAKCSVLPSLQGREKTDRYLPPHRIPFTHAPEIAFTSRAIDM